MSYKHVRLEKDAIGRLVLCRPERRNALNAQLMQEIVAGLRELDADETVRVIIVKGEGLAFCAGADLDELVQGDSIMDKRAQKENVSNMIETLGRISKLTIAQVHGYALAGGCGLAASCDLGIAAEDTVFALPEILRALFPMTVMVPITRCIGRKKAMDLYFTGRRISGREAAEIGLVNKAVPLAEVEEEAEKLAERIAAQSPAALKLGKEAFYTMQDMEYFTALRYLKDMILITTLTDDAREGVRAFFEKRDPQWKGK